MISNLTEPNALDLLGAIENLTTEESALQKKAESFVSSQVTPIIASCFEDARFPIELVPEMGRLGLLGTSLDLPFRQASSHLGNGLVMLALERGDSALRSFATVQGSLVMFPILTFGTEEQQACWLPRLATGSAIGCFGLTEPDGGSDPAAMKTTAIRSGSDWILNGVKTWITNAPLADVAVVWARTHEGIQGFLVEKGTPGFTSAAIERKLSLRASSTGLLLFEECRIPDSQRLPTARGLRTALQCLNEARFSIIWGVTGAMSDVLDEVLTFTRQRHLFGTPLGNKQLIQMKIAEMAQSLALALLLAQRLSQLKQAKSLFPAQISLGKKHNCEVARTCARTARDLLGANGIRLDARCMRHSCNLESVVTYEGTTDIHTLSLGQTLTGLAAF